MTRLMLSCCSCRVWVVQNLKSSNKLASELSASASAPFGCGSTNLGICVKLHSQGFHAALSHDAKHQALNEVMSLRQGLLDSIMCIHSVQQVYCEARLHAMQWLRYSCTELLDSSAACSTHHCTTWSQQHGSELQICYGAIAVLV